MIGNLLRNAAEAIAAAGRSSGFITVSVHNADERVELHIRDDGEGFYVEIGANLFQREFPTQVYKSGRLGLYWCGSAMAAMQRLAAAGERGEGQGSRCDLDGRA